MFDIIDATAGSGNQLVNEVVIPKHILQAQVLEDMTKIRDQVNSHFGKDKLQIYEFEDVGGNTVLCRMFDFDGPDDVAVDGGGAMLDMCWTPEFDTEKAIVSIIEENTMG